MRLRRTPRFHDIWICKNQETQPIHGVLIVITTCFCAKIVQKVMMLGPLNNRARVPLYCDAHIR